jgi:hypothetical protein
MKSIRPISAREQGKTSKSKKKRNLDNTSLIHAFGKSPENIWDKDIYTGEGNFSF